MMRYLCRPASQHDGVNSRTGLKTERGKRGGGKFIKWSDCANTILCSSSQHKAESGGGPQSSGVGRG